MAKIVFNPRIITTGNPIPFFFQPQGDKDTPVAISLLGTDVLSNLVFAPGSYTRDGLTTNFEGIQLNTVLLNITQTKNVIVTPIQGRNGTFKEYISDGDYFVQVSGVVTSNVPDQYPAEDVRLLNEIFKVPEALEFTSEFIDRFGSFNMVITDFSLPQQEGRRDSQIFTFTMISDEPFELELNQDEIIQLTSENEVTITEIIEL